MRQSLAFAPQRSWATEQEAESAGLQEVCVWIHILPFVFCVTLEGALDVSDPHLIINKYLKQILVEIKV